MQIRTRLTLQFMLIVASIMLAAMLIIYFQFKSHLQQEFFGNLRSKANLTVSVAMNRLERDGLQEVPNTPAAKSFTPFTENISIYDDQNRRVYTFNPSPADFKPATLAEIRKMGECQFKHSGYSAIGTSHEGSSGKRYVVIAEAIFKPEALTKLTRILVMVFCATCLLVAIGGWFFAGQALGPVSRIMNQVDALLPSDMNRRLETSRNNDELARLVVTFNRLLDRLQTAFNAQKLFLSNISHELKNPLTVITSQIEIILQKDRTEAEYRQTLQSVLDDTRELNLVSDKLMQLAKITASGQQVEFEKIRIDEAVWQAKAALLKSHPDYKINFEIVNLPEDEALLYVKANDHLLRTALTNLMDNGCKYSPDHHVKVRLLFLVEGNPAIEIQDRGPGIPEAELPLVFEPFYRSPKTDKVKGSGVGLSLVDSIVKLHRIELKVSNLQPSGSVFRLEFPMIND
ncbi:MAG: HAMP domain-containing histidine kinase [Saprospiraceae bacterium]|nr:HAMP domain-containing histidine kinase [Saprospiraceae bacterium]MCF8249383.1 HAMP domain-containing histidine kinase [Saprospiraceae bacterium]MCF8279037.1 HAMP domain-containing histidine kinase [Bacteroidales bacterium]MCF8311512.1 HAMP domain-containing histidine kinase [Saprospiraceae bacterium]MCF8440002.1 HAMP domain-containing histidine kinase [Saprospiraceae bacterium]